MTSYSFSQVDVFAPEPLCGNPVAVVHDANGLADRQMADFARWTNLSETTFLVPPTDPTADYRLRIFTPCEELPFAGHPTLGSAHAWLAQGGVPRTPGHFVQQCGLGLIEVRQSDDGLAFRAPDLLRGGEIDGETLDRAIAALRVDRTRVVRSNWIDNGNGVVGVIDRPTQVEADLPGGELVGDRACVRQRPCKSVQLGHHQGVALATGR